MPAIRTQASTTVKRTAEGRRAGEQSRGGVATPPPSPARHPYGKHFPPPPRLAPPFSPLSPCRTMNALMTVVLNKECRFAVLLCDTFYCATCSLGGITFYDYLSMSLFTVGVLHRCRCRGIMSMRVSSFITLQKQDKARA